MSVRKIGFDRATLDGKVILDDDQFLVMPAVIARAIVHDYPQGSLLVTPRHGFVGVVS